LRIINVTIPAAPVETGSFNTPGYSYGVIKSGSYAIVADDYAGFRAINVNNPAAPIETGYYDLPGNVRAIAASERYLYVLDPSYMGIYEFTPSYAMSVLTIPINAPITIPANGGSFQYYINIHNLTMLPQPVSIWNMVRDESNHMTNVFGPVLRMLPGNESPSKVVNQRIAATVPSGALSFITYVGDYPSNIKDSSSFSITKSTLEDGGASISESLVSGDVFEEYGNVSSGAPHAVPIQAVLLGASPNPFNPKTVISYQLSAISFVNLSVYDITGRKIIELVNGMRDAGMQSVPFDGSKLASGIYLYKLTASGSGPTGMASQTTPTTLMQKMVLMK